MTQTQPQSSSLCHQKNILQLHTFFEGGGSPLLSASPAPFTPFTAPPGREGPSLDPVLFSSAVSRPGLCSTLSQAFSTMVECWLNRLMRDELQGFDDAADSSKDRPYPCVIKVKFLYSAVSMPLDCSKRFTLNFPSRPVQSNTINFSRNYPATLQLMHKDCSKHISTTVYSQVLIHAAE